MKSNIVSRWVGGSALALGLALASSTLPAAAQTTTEPVTPTTPGTVDSANPDGTAPGSTVPGETYPDPVTPAAPGTVDPATPGTVSPDATAPNDVYADPVAPNTTATTTEDNDSSWGWLGLLGLLGLAGLAKRDRRAPVYTSEDRVVNHTSTNPRI